MIEFLQASNDLFLAFTEFARNTPWLNGPALWFTDHALMILGGLMVLAVWTARCDRARLAAAIIAPLTLLVAAAVNRYGLKPSFGELRPCNSFPDAFILHGCEPLPAELSFPSGHSISIAAAGMAIYMADRRLGAIALPIAFLTGLSRIYVGAHYPHDVVAGLLSGSVLAVVFAFAASALAARLPKNGLVTGDHPAQDEEQVGQPVQVLSRKPVHGLAVRLHSGPGRTLRPTSNGARHMQQSRSGRPTGQDEAP